MQYQTNYPYATSSHQYGAISHQREEQRRRQAEYSQALAQQVAQREQQKRREREMDQSYSRRNGFQNPPPQNFQQSRQEAFEPVERSIFDGLGHNNPHNSRTSFARGQQQTQEQQQQQQQQQQSQQLHVQQLQQQQQHQLHQQQQLQQLQQPQLHHRLPGGPGPFEYSQPVRSSYVEQPSYPQPPVDHQSGFSFPTYQQPPVQNNVGANMPPGWPQQMRSNQFVPGQGIEQPVPSGGFSGYSQPPEHGNGGRRFSRGDSEEAEKIRRKLQQQQEMQLALERQIEEKRQQKLEAKRQKEEEDRRELLRFEEDQRRQRAEEERLQEEKRRKAELEQQKAQQAAAAVAAANELAKAQQQQKLHAQMNQPQLPPQPFHQEHHLQHPDRFPSKNPFTNSRAHLFEDSPVHPSNQNQNMSPIRDQRFQQDNNNGGYVDPSELRRQYDDMREELRRQQHLVDQLRQAQAQIQQQQLLPTKEERESTPTLQDLEKLRNELRGELEYREQLHRQELESLKREQQERLERSPSRYERVKKTLESAIEPQHDFKRDSTQVEAPLDESLRSLCGESKFVYFGRASTVAKTRETQTIEENEEEEDALDDNSKLIEVETSPVKPQEVVVMSVSPSKGNQEEVGAESEDFVVAAHQMLPSPSFRLARSHRPALSSSSQTAWRLESMGINDESDSDDDLDDSLDGEQLEALFQRNVRRHEILLGFQSKLQRQQDVPDDQKEGGTPRTKLAWAELHRQLENNRRASTLSQLQTKPNDLKEEARDIDEAALVASSKWMPSLLQQQTQKVNK
ncbi:hypothetical protein P3T76_001819 [Phytophthora citrophthora]|uniref:Uncharacterized protein n=1 Tax=Phytophthora citrophthora TaxID=4793 RepID=A0AAD9LRT8_9STRA|nr:hypothetical protein P3T76_001819 [Phytophthora citrophthora]